MIHYLGYLPVEELHELAGCHEYCDACFTGNYPTRIPTDTRKDSFEQKISAKPPHKGESE